MRPNRPRSMDIRRLHAITTVATEAQARARALFRQARNISSQRRLQWIASELYEVERVVRRGADQVTQTAAADVEWLLAFYLSELRRAEDALGQHPHAS